MTSHDGLFDEARKEESGKGRGRLGTKRQEVDGKETRGTKKDVHTYRQSQKARTRGKIENGREKKED